MSRGRLEFWLISWLAFLYAKVHGLLSQRDVTESWRNSLGNSEQFPPESIDRLEEAVIDSLNVVPVGNGSSSGFQIDLSHYAMEVIADKVVNALRKGLLALPKEWNEVLGGWYNQVSFPTSKSGYTITLNIYVTNTKHLMLQWRDTFGTTLMERTFYPT